MVDRNFGTFLPKKDLLRKHLRLFGLLSMMAMMPRISQLPRAPALRLTATRSMFPTNWPFSRTDWIESKDLFVSEEPNECEARNQRICRRGEENSSQEPLNSGTAQRCARRHIYRSRRNLKSLPNGLGGLLVLVLTTGLIGADLPSDAAGDVAKHSSRRPWG